MPHLRPNALAIVMDGRKALFLERSGTPPQVHLSLKKSLAAEENPPTREQGTDSPGRSFQSMGRTRSAVEQTDWHELGEQRFVRQVVADLVALHRVQPIEKLTLVAPSKALSYLRQELPPFLKTVVDVEIDKDLVGLPVGKIEHHLSSL